MNESFNALTKKLRDKTSELLQQETISLFIGYASGTYPTRITPVFINKHQHAENLIWSPFCTNNLVTYLLDYRDTTQKIGLLVKGCDSRAIVRLLQDKQIERGNLYIIGVSCPGLLDEEKVSGLIKPGEQIKEIFSSGASFQIVTDQGEYRLEKKEYLSPKCLACDEPNPVIADEVLNEPVSHPVSLENRYQEVETLERMSPEEKSAFWDNHFRDCLRCFACRNVCPACNCRECVFDEAGSDWISKRHNLSENTAFHLIRAFHVAGRCVDCGECDRVCPVNIPLRLLNRKILKDIEELYGANLPGTNLEEKPALGHFSMDDPDEFK